MIKHLINRYHDFCKREFPYSTCSICGKALPRSGDRFYLEDAPVCKKCFTAKTTKEVLK